MVCAKRTSFIIPAVAMFIFCDNYYAVTVFFAHCVLSAVLVFKLLSDSLAFLVFPANLQFVVQTKWCSIIFNNMVLSTGRVKFGKLRILTNRFLQIQGSTLPTILNLLLLKGFWGNNYAHVIFTTKADSLTDRC